MLTVLWIAVAFVFGSFPFSYWLGHLFLHKDIRDYGDGAPGATNVARAGSKSLYVIACLMDAFKGAAAIWLAIAFSNIGGWKLVAVAISPVLGHAFTPFLRFRGGMGVATTYGVWLSLAGLIGPITLGACMGLMFIIQKNWVWASIGGMLGFLIFLLATQLYLPYSPVICAGHTGILVAKRYTYLKSWPELQPWLHRISGGNRDH